MGSRRRINIFLSECKGDRVVRMASQSPCRCTGEAVLGKRSGRVVGRFPKDLVSEQTEERLTGKTYAISNQVKVKRLTKGIPPLTAFDPSNLAALIH